MTIETARIHEILDAYGGDSARWPVEERDEALARVAADPVLLAAHDEARSFDAQLAGWARGGAPASDGAAVAARVLAPARWPRFAAGGLAAAVALFIAVNPFTSVVKTPVTTSAVVATADTDIDSTAFSALFTPTPDEETII
jgi:hypothetical protein